jgi:hypothetical protein
VPTEKVFEVAAATGAVPYDIPGAEPFTHVGELSSFDAFLTHYNLTDPALRRLALIVRAADTDRLDLAPQAAGLLAVSLGLSASYQDDHEMLEHAMTIYDASMPGVGATNTRRARGGHDLSAAQVRRDEANPTIQGEVP